MPTTVPDLVVRRPGRRVPGSVWLPTAGPVIGWINFGWTQQYILGVNPPVLYGADLYLSWVSNAPIAAGLVFQVYVNRLLAWSGTGLSAVVPAPPVLARFDIGTVAAANANVGYAYLLPGAPAREASLSWLGGTYEDPDIVGFHVSGEATPGGGIQYGNVLATVPAYTQGIVTDGYGYGGFGQGGYGESAASYGWTSGPLTSGTWNWAVRPFDDAGNEGTAATTAVLIEVPPLEPALFSDGTRLHYSYSQATFEVTLTWNASPGC